MESPRDGINSPASRWTPYASRARIRARLPVDAIRRPKILSQRIHLSGSTSPRRISLRVGFWRRRRCGHDAWRTRRKRLGAGHPRPMCVSTHSTVFASVHPRQARDPPSQMACFPVRFSCSPDRLCLNNVPLLIIAHRSNGRDVWARPGGQATAFSHRCRSLETSRSNVRNIASEAMSLLRNIASDMRTGIRFAGKRSV